MAILHMSLSIPTSPQSLSSAKAFSGGPISLPLTTKLSHLSLNINPYKTTPIRMGGGPRTFPGGVSKWQWKRMQAKKAKQLLKARLARERQIYEMRKRAELKAAVSELERPWETVEKPPNLFSVGSDEQLKVLADRFQKPGGFDMWSERDGPELFRPDDSGLPSSRFFPKGVVHSVKPYGKIADVESRPKELEGSGPDPVTGGGEEMGLRRKGYRGNSRSKSDSLVLNKGGNGSDFGPRSSSDAVKEGENGNFVKGRLRKNGDRRNYGSDTEEKKSENIRLYRRDDGRNRHGDSAGEFRRSKGYENDKSMNLEVFDMRLRNDGSYGFELENKGC